MKDRRTKAQRDFDLAKHGWAFCNREMLKRRLPQLKQIAKRLASNDVRHEELKHIEEQSS